VQLVTGVRLNSTLLCSCSQDLNLNGTLLCSWSTSMCPLPQSHVVMLWKPWLSTEEMEWVSSSPLLFLFVIFGYFSLWSLFYQPNPKSYGAYFGSISCPSCMYSKLLLGKFRKWQSESEAKMAKSMVYVLFFTKFCDIFVGFKCINIQICLVTHGRL